MFKAPLPLRGPGGGGRNGWLWHVHTTIYIYTHIYIYIIYIHTCAIPHTFYLHLLMPARSWRTETRLAYTPSSLLGRIRGSPRAPITAAPCRRWLCLPWTLTPGVAWPPATRAVRRKGEALARKGRQTGAELRLSRF